MQTGNSHQGLAPGVKLKNGRRDHMSKGAQAHAGVNHRNSQPKLEATHGLWTDLCGTCMGPN